MFDWRQWRVKKFLVMLWTSNSERLINHTSWSTRLKSRNYNFDQVYKNYVPDDVSNANVGAGPYFQRKHWVSVDFLPDFQDGDDKSRIHHDLARDPDKLPVSDLSNIYTSHTLEHFEISISRRLLKSMFSSTRRGGRVRAVVPDAGYVLDNYREGRLGGLEYFEAAYGSERPSPEDYVFQLLAQNYCRILYKKPNPRYDPAIYDEFKNRIKGSSNDEVCLWMNSLPSFQDAMGTLHCSSYTATILMEMFRDAGFAEVYQSGFMKSKSPEMREVPLFDGTHPWLSLYIEGEK